MADYIPQSDAEYDIWQDNLVLIVLASAAGWGIPTEDVQEVTDAQSFWKTAFAKASNKQNRTSADVAAKEDARKGYDKVLRTFIAQWLASNTKVTDSDRIRMGLSVKSTTRTATPKPSSAPVGNIDFSVRLQHLLHFFDESTPRSKAKPTGVHGCEIYYKIDGASPTDESEMIFVATSTATPFTINFEGKHAGKIVYYRFRWVNSRGERGPWSSVISATIVG
ncbi:hypothetical protein [Parabacteroides sp. FAFU027]|uniref:hypothetical protein n=1 Tax=Parabacteroides sp. FAFU027 TaxID=2922715 RepID=UPI001FB00E51|nr:hypothetical protein [Parabacteroides sp. FAFU027]